MDTITVNPDNTLLSFYCPHCKNRIETSLDEVKDKDTFPCPACHRDIAEDFKALADDLNQGNKELTP